MTGGAQCWGGNFRGQLGNGTTSTLNGGSVPGASQRTHEQRHGECRQLVLVCGRRGCSDVLGVQSELGARQRHKRLDHRTRTSQRVDERRHSNRYGLRSCVCNRDGCSAVWGTALSSKVPVPVSGLASGATAISSNSSHDCVIVNGAAKCWGTNTNGKLGDGTLISSSTPVLVRGLSVGNGTIEAPETCDDGNLDNTDSCVGTGQPASVGDGFIRAGIEDCDDNNAR